MAKLEIVDPRGYPPARMQMPMAPRVDFINNKTIYIVDVNWPYTHQFSLELAKVFSERYPDSKFEARDKAGTYMVDDPLLWNEIKEKGDAVIMTTGH